MNSVKKDELRKAKNELKRWESKRESLIKHLSENLLLNSYTQLTKIARCEVFKGFLESVYIPILECEELSASVELANNSLESFDRHLIDQVYFNSMNPWTNAHFQVSDEVVKREIRPKLIKLVSLLGDLESIEKENN